MTRIAFLMLAAFAHSDFWPVAGQTVFDKHWSLPRAPAVPHFKMQATEPDALAVDAFVLERLHNEGYNLRPRPIGHLVRRLTFDLQDGCRRTRSKRTFRIALPAYENSSTGCWPAHTTANGGAGTGRRCPLRRNRGFEYDRERPARAFTAIVIAAFNTDKPYSRCPRAAGRRRWADPITPCGRRLKSAQRCAQRRQRRCRL